MHPGRKMADESTPVRRTQYEHGTASYWLEEGGRSVRVVFSADGALRLHFPREVVRIDQYANSPDGWTNVSLVKAGA